MPTQQIVSQHENAMKKAIEFLQTELRSVRTGRASAGLVENLVVDYYGSPTPLKQMATIATASAPPDKRSNDDCEKPSD